jgi:peptidoglycan/xylan/chitin deacetylase (PgdA/CDA1 family)
MSAIDPLKDALDSAFVDGRTVDVFFRDDDADDNRPNLHRLLDLFLECFAPISLAVIPGTLTGSGAELLGRLHNQAPQLVELIQHGWVHINHELEGRKCEFGPSRVYACQLEDIERGRDTLNAAFGNRWHKAFTPPWNRCTGDTLRALDELGFTVLSRDVSETSGAGRRFCEIPVTFDIFTWKKGVTLKSESDIAAGIAAQVRAGNRIGILLHHKVMTADAFRLVASLLKEFRRSPQVKLHTLGSLANSQRQGELSACYI